MSVAKGLLRLYGCVCSVNRVVLRLLSELQGSLDYSNSVVFLYVGVEVQLLSRRYTYIVIGHDCLFQCAL